MGGAGIGTIDGDVVGIGTVDVDGAGIGSVDVGGGVAAVDEGASVVLVEV